MAHRPPGGKQAAFFHARSSGIRVHKFPATPSAHSEADKSRPVNGLPEPNMPSLILILIRTRTSICPPAATSARNRQLI